MLALHVAMMGTDTRYISLKANDSHLKNSLENHNSHWQACQAGFVRKTLFLTYHSVHLYIDALG